ncbi:MAG: lipid-A-disaccharide synthase [Candidatus Koribacter versatilis]|uniref:Lipid-A-disaccharide synthase n=1 Tax=Candidatus Korobacter versatilis TaxID=658062 RepID=A0A932A876_9BACT|nr:lipid-A-disaccharide synthase [Candidatus Koribacter versatilis]
MKRILISAGEASGELYAVGLMRALKQRIPDAEFFGVGGEAMRAAGCDIVVESKHLSVVGITEIVSHLPKLYGEFRKLIREAGRRKPDAAIVIDSPAFNFKVAKELHARGVPVIYYVAPQLWAWREKRIARFHKWIKKALVIFPFEEHWYKDRGVDAEFVGHPLAEMPPPSITRDQYAAKYKLDAKRQWIALLPGSRKKEVGMNLPTLLDVSRLIPKLNQVGGGDPPAQLMLPVAPAIDSPWVTAQLGNGAIHLVEDAPAALHFSRAAVVASGTATVQAALAGTPFVIVYRVSPLTWKLGRGLLKVPYVGMPNLIAGRQIVPELLQHDFTPGNVAKELRPLLEDTPARERMVQDLAEVKERLQGGPRSSLPAAERAAEAVLRALGWA